MKRVCLCFLLVAGFFLSCNRSTKVKTTRQSVVAEPLKADTVTSDSTIESKPVQRYESQNPTRSIEDAKLENNKVSEEDIRIISGVFNGAVQKHNAGDRRGAIQDYLIVLEKDPENYPAYFNLGIIYFELNDLKLAEAYFQDARSFNPSDSAAPNYLGIIKYKQNQLQASIDFYNEAIEKGPFYGMAYYNRGTSYGRLKNYTEAVSDFTEAITLRPSHAESYQNRAIAYFYLKDIPKACEDWKKAEELGHPQAKVALDAYCK